MAVTSGLVQDSEQSIVKPHRLIRIPGRTSYRLYAAIYFALSVQCLTIPKRDSPGKPSCGMESGGP